MSTIVLLLALIATAFLPTGVATSDSLSGIYPGDTAGDCCWLSDSGTIHVSPPPDATALVLDVVIPDFALTAGPQQLAVNIGTQAEQSSEPLSAGEHELVFNLPETTLPAQLDVGIRPSYTFVPAQLGMNQDPRHLSILVRGIRFTTESDVPELPPDAPPEIVFLRLNNTVFSSGDAVTGAVTTSSNVASVEARIATVSIPVPKVSEGRFALNYTVPKLPRFLKNHTYDLVIIARNTAGVESKRVVPITLR